MKHFIKAKKRDKMNKKKIIIFAILFVGVVGLALSPASAGSKTYKTGKLYFKYNGDSKRPISKLYKSIDSKTEIEGLYTYPKNKNSQQIANSMIIGMAGKVDKKSYKQYKPNYKINKAVIMFKKTVKGKTYYSSKTFTKFYQDMGNGYMTDYSPKNNYKPYYAIVYYKKV